jgi:hypothetical protein
MSSRRAISALMVLAAALLTIGGLGAASAQATTTCSWGGTPIDPTGIVEYAGLGPTNTPSTAPLPFTATGSLAGACTGKLTYRGQQAAGTTCAAGAFEATAKGLPGVVRAAGEGITALIPAFLYDKAGNVVGEETAQVLTNANQEESPAFTSCNTPEGFQGGNFSSVVELYR